MGDSAKTLGGRAGQARLAGCPACGHARRRTAGSRGELRLHRCTACGLVFSDPQPREEVERRYRETYDLAAHFGAREARKTLLYERRLARLPSPSAGHDRLFDVGCADGQFLELARDAGWQVCGVDLNPPAVMRTRARGIEVFEGSLETMEDLPWHSFDLVTSWDVLEHTAQPRAFAERVARLLVPGGWLALTTLNRRSLAFRVFGTRWSMVVPDHFTYWDRHSLRSLFTPLGLSVVREETFGLGRDFVQWVDSISGSARGGRDPKARVRSGGWDTSRGVVLFERALNAGFRRLGGGVGVEMVLRAPMR
jgi:2-polyprenyl-3-methyl-5-hydroxy-6-metoxy-1,4-benzoquinol methylase